jgi:hypothetical protein
LAPSKDAACKLLRFILRHLNKVPFIILSGKVRELRQDSIRRLLLREEHLGLIRFQGDASAE